MAVLTWLSGEKKNQRVSIGEQLVLGRAKNVDVRLDDRRSSREHTRVFAADGLYRVEDLGSRNGTFVNDMQVTVGSSVELRPGDILRIGLSWFYFGEPTISEDNLDVFVGYKVTRQLLHHQGGMLLEALQEALERKVHLRVLSIQIAADAQLIHRRFIEEVRTVAKLVHRNISLLLDFGARKMYLYAAFEFLEGEELTGFVETHGPLPVQTALEFGMQLAGGLDYAHRQGVSHLNLQPEVVLLDGSRPIIRDFGISRLVGELTSDEQTSLGMVGINAYTAPEMASGSKGGDQSDIYSFGMVLYYLLTGKPPYEESSPYDLIDAHLKRVPVAIRELRPEVPQPVQDAVGQMIAKEPRDRPRDFKAVIQALETCRTAFEVIEIRRAHEERAGRRGLLGQLLGNAAACWVVFVLLAFGVLGGVYVVLRS